jgi:hypothetical protein
MDDCNVCIGNHRVKDIVWHDDWWRQPLLGHDFMNMYLQQWVHAQEIVGNDVYYAVHAEAV